MIDKPLLKEYIAYARTRVNPQLDEEAIEELVSAYGTLRQDGLCDLQSRSADDPGLGLVNGAVCSDCDLAADDVQVIASGKASVTVRVCEGVGAMEVCVWGGSNRGVGGGNRGASVGQGHAATGCNCCVKPDTRRSAAPFDGKCKKFVRSY
eukprot:363427-Chlamydomonas_euryale.AAC.1